MYICIYNVAITPKGTPTHRRTVRLPGALAHCRKDEKLFNCNVKRNAWTAKHMYLVPIAKFNMTKKTRKKEFPDVRPVSLFESLKV